LSWRAYGWDFEAANFDYFPQFSSASRFTAGAFGFLIFVKSSVQRFRIIALAPECFLPGVPKLKGRRTAAFPLPAAWLHSPRSAPASKYLVVIWDPDNTNDYEDNHRRNYYRAEYFRGRRYRIAPAQP